MKIGDLVKLPSGRKVRVMCAAEKGRPWAAVEITPSSWHVCRDHGQAGHGGVSHYFNTSRPLQLDAADARELAKLLNGVRSA